MPKYFKMPVPSEWKFDTGQIATKPGMLLGTIKQPQPLTAIGPMSRIGELLAEYDTLPKDDEQDDETATAKLILGFQLYRHATYLLKPNVLHKTKKSADEITTKMESALRHLSAFLKGELGHAIGAGEDTFDEDLLVAFGRGVNDHSQGEDERELAQDTLQYYTTDLARARLKLSLRRGLAFKHVLGENNEKTGQGGLYDTQAARDAIEHGGSLYVLDPRGRIYVSGNTHRGTLKHSSFLGGGQALCAGTMRIEQGQVVWVSCKSGHYQPKVTQMITLLERLTTYQVNLANVTVIRENYTQANFPNAPTNNGRPIPSMEPCRALDFLARRSWPTGVSPQNMWVDGPHRGL